MKKRNNLSFNILLVILLIIFMKPLPAQSIVYELEWLDYYKAVPGKSVGIWPHWNRWLDVNKIKDLYFYSGFNKIIAYPHPYQPVYQNIIEAGYTPDQIMVKFDQQGELVMNELLNFPASWAYYVDEPADENFSQEWMNEAKSFVNNNFPDSKFIISGYKRTSLLTTFVTMSDYVLFSSYKHWWLLFGFWVSCCPEDPDQRPDWGDMKNRYGNKFDMTWIGAHKDLSEYPQLINYAAILGLSTIWLYQHDDTWDDDNNIKSFVTQAAAHGYLNTFYRQVRLKKNDGVVVQKQFLGPEYAGSIPVLYDHSNLIFNYDYTVTNNRIENFYAPDSIIAGGSNGFVIPSGKNATLNSHEKIRLKPGFHAMSGSSFNAYIGNK